MARPIVYDVARMTLAAARATPRGIERVDLGYAAHLFEHWPEECVGLLPTPWGVRTFPRNTVLRGKPYFDAIWREDAASVEGPVNRPGRRELADGRRAHPGLMGIARLLTRTGLSLGGSTRAIAPGSLYLNMGHDSLSQPWLLRWLTRRPDVLPIFMLHDMIPLTHPAFVEPAATRRHARVLASASRFARLIVTPSVAASAEVETAMRERGLRAVPTAAIPLPVSDIFIAARRPAGEVGERPPYFVICGALELRKNHAVLLDAWTRIRARRGAECPTLFVVGSRAAKSASVERALSRAREEGLPIHWLDGVSTPALIQLLAGARALLMPSHAEGFGLPIAEALAMGRPVLASALAAHREAGGDSAAYLPGDDRKAWADWIERISFDRDSLRAAEEKALRFRPRNWRDYMGEATELLSAL